MTLDRAAVVRLLHERCSPPWMAHWEDLETYEREGSEWWVIADAIIELEQPSHLDATRATEVLDWCKREGGLDLYGWGDLISRLQDCVVPMPPDAPARVSEAYRQGYAEALKYEGS